MINLKEVIHIEELLTIPITNNELYDEIIKEHLDDRRIIINQEIDDSLLETVVLMIIKWNNEDKNLPIEHRKNIYIYINSSGGDCIQGMQILSIIKASKTPVVTVGFGKCASMASYILVAGHKRYCFPNTVVLYHDGTTGYVSSGNKGKDIQKFYDKLDEKLSEFMIENTFITKEFLDEIKDREYYIFPDEAKEKGIVDCIIGSDCELDEIL